MTRHKLKNREDKIMSTMQKKVNNIRENNVKNSRKSKGAIKPFATTDKQMANLVEPVSPKDKQNPTVSSDETHSDGGLVEKRAQKCRQTKPLKSMTLKDVALNKDEDKTADTQAHSHVSKHFYFDCEGCSAEYEEFGNRRFEEGRKQRDEEIKQAIDDWQDNEDDCRTWKEVREELFGGKA